jgi:hypothetical protein
MRSRVDEIVGHPSLLRHKGAPRSSFAKLAGVGLVVLVAACRSGGVAPTAAPPPAAIPTVTLSAADLPGRWGLASYRVETDRARTETEAKGACGNPYKIEAGANGGVMMHLADQSAPSEVFVKTDSSGRVFIGPLGPPAVQQDRQVMSYENGVLVAAWLDAGVRERFGTMVFVRCGAA